MPTRSGPPSWGWRWRPWERSAPGRRTLPPSASPTSGRPPSSGTGPPRAGIQRHRLAVPPHQPLLRRAQGAGPHGFPPAADGPGHRRLLLRHQAQVDFGQRARSPKAGGAGGAALRHGGNLAHLEALRRAHPRHRLLQRRPHHALQHQHPHLGSGDFEDYGHPRLPAAHLRPQQPGLWRDGPQLLRPPHPHRRGRRGPAGGPVRPDLL